MSGGFWAGGEVEGWACAVFEYAGSGGGGFEEGGWGGRVSTVLFDGPFFLSFCEDTGR